MRHIIAATLVAFAIGATACADNGQPTMTRTVTVTQAPPTTTAPTEAQQAENVRQAVMTAAGLDLSTVPDSDIVTLGQSICSTLDTQGVSIESLYSILQRGMDAGFTPEQAGVITGAEIATFCPQYADEVLRISGSVGEGY